VVDRRNQITTHGKCGSKASRITKEVLGQESFSDSGQRDKPDKPNQPDKPE